MIKLMKKRIQYSITPAKGQALLQFNGRKFPKKIDLLETELVEKIRHKSKKDLLEKDKNINPNFTNILLQGDCISTCAYLQSKKIKIDLVYIDPPFSSGVNYTKKIYLRESKKSELKKKHNIIGEEVMYGDVWQKEDYLNWLYESLLVIRDVMSKKASIYVHLDWHIGHYVKILLDEIFGEENFVNEIIWYYNSGARSDHFGKRHDSIFVYAKSRENIIFQADNVRVPYSENINIPKSKEKYYHKKGKVADNVWAIPIIAQNDKTERENYPTQKPIKLLERIIQASSLQGMIVADFFSGSGTTAKVANSLKRKFISCDIGVNAIQTSRDRLVKAKVDFDIYKIQPETKKTKKALNAFFAKKKITSSMLDSAVIEMIKQKNKYKVEIKKFCSPYLKNKIADYNSKIKSSKKNSTIKENQQNNKKALRISDSGLELIEAVQFDTMLGKVWQSNLELEDKASEKNKIKGIYLLETDQFKIKLRNIAGFEVIISSDEIATSNKK